MPRVTLRTVEPAKALACQSVEKRCTRWNASCEMSLIIFSVSVMRLMKENWRSTTESEPEPEQDQEGGDRRVHRDVAVRPAGRHRLDEVAGKQRRQHVGDGRAEETEEEEADAHGLLSPVPGGEPQHLGKGLGAEIDLESSHVSCPAARRRRAGPNRKKDVECAGERVPAGDGGPVAVRGRPNGAPGALRAEVDDACSCRPSLLR